MTQAAHFAGRAVLITGGLGFVGSSLAIALVRAGARVAVLDALIPGYGGNEHNLAPVREQVEVHLGDIRAQEAMNALVQGQEFIFHCAGQVSHVLGMQEPFRDIDLNLRGTAVLLEACRHHNPGAVVVYAGTRGQYGAATSLPVTEEAPCRPLAVHEITKHAAEQLCQMYTRSFGIKSVLCRLTNLYGPRSQMKSAGFGVVNWMLRLALEGKQLQVFGDGQVLRDFLYIDDAVEAMLALAATPSTYGEPYNIGSGAPCSLLALAQALVDAAQAGSYALAPYTPERKAQEPGSFYCDIQKITAATGWRPRTSLEDGLHRTAAYYREHHAWYWDR